MIAKGKVGLSVDKLKELFNLPEEIEILSVSVENGLVEFNIASRDPIGRLTIDVPDWNNLRINRVPREKIQASRMPIMSARGDDISCKCPDNNQRYIDMSFEMCATCHHPIKDLRLLQNKRN